MTTSFAHKHDVSHSQSLTITKTVSGSFNLRNLISETLPSKFNLRNLISKTLPSNFVQRGLPSKTIPSKFNLRILVSETLPSKFNLRSLVSKTVSTSFIIRSLPVKTIPSKFNLRGLVSETLPSKFNLRDLVSETLPSKFNLRGLVSETLPSNFVQRGLVSKTVSFASQNLFLISKTIPSKFNLRSLVPETLPSKFNLRSLVPETLPSKFTLRELISKTVSFAYSQGGLLTKTTPSSFELREITSYEAPGDVDDATYDNFSRTTSVFLGVPTEVTFNHNGTQLLVTGHGLNKLQFFNLSTPYDITGTVTTGGISIGEESNPNGIAFNGTGTKMFIVGSEQNTVHQYSLPTPGTLTGETYDGDDESLDVSAQTTSPFSIEFSDDGMKLFVLGNLDNEIFQYDLTAPYDVSTGVYNDVSFDLSDEIGDARSITFDSTGLKLYVINHDSTDEEVHQYDLDFPFDLSSIQYNDVTFDLSGQSAAPKGIAISNTATKMIILGQSNTRIYQYSIPPLKELESKYEINTILSKTVSGSFAVREIVPFYTETDNVSTADYTGKNFDAVNEDTALVEIKIYNNGTKMYLVGTENEKIYQYTLSIPYDVSSESVTYDNKSFSVPDDELNPNGFLLNSTGTKMYFLGSTEDLLRQYTLTTAYDISTATYDGNSEALDVSSESDNPTEIIWGNDGLKLYIVDSSDDYISPYTLSTAYDVSTASYDGDDNRFRVRDQDLAPQSIALNSAGTKLYMLGLINRRVYQYTLSTPWVISTASYDNNSYYIGDEELNPRGLEFDDTGSMMYIVGANDIVYQYQLDTFDELRSEYELTGVASKTVSSNFAIRNRVGQTLDISSQDAVTADIMWNDNGTKLYYLGRGNDVIYQYSVSEPYQLYTATYDGDSESFDISDETTTPNGMTWNDNGTKLYIISSNDNIYTYSLTTAYDISTATYDGDDEIFDVGNQQPAPSGLRFNNDGSKMYISGLLSSNIGVHEYDLSTNYRVNTATYNNIGLNTSNEEITNQALALSSDGTKLYMVGQSKDTVFQYTLSTAFNVSTATYDGTSLNIRAQELNPRGLDFNSDGTKMYIVGNSSDKVHQYSLSTAYDISTAEYDPKTIPSSLSIRVLATKTVSSQYDLDGVTDKTISSNFELRNRIQDTIASKFSVREILDETIPASFAQRRLLSYESGGIRTASYSGNSHSLTNQETLPAGVRLSPDGTKMYIVGFQHRRIYQYTLNVPFSLEDVDYDGIDSTFGVLGIDSDPTGLWLGNNGTKLYTSGNGNNRIYEFTLSTAYQVSTADFTGSLGIGGSSDTPGRDNNIRDVELSEDGTKMYFVGIDRDSVHQYTLSTPFDITTATYDGKSLDLSSEENTPTGLTITNNGTKLFIVGQQNKTVYRYSMSRPYDLDTAIPDVSYNVSSRDNLPRGIHISPDDSEMFIVDVDDDVVTQYSMIPLSDALESSYRQDGITTKTISSNYEQREVISKTVSSSFAQREILDETVSSSFSIRGLVSKTVSFAAQNLELVSKTVSSAFSIRGLVSKTVNFAAQNAGLVIKTVQSKFQIRGLVEHYRVLDVTNATHTDSKGVNGLPRGVEISRDGLRLYIISDDPTEGRIYQYNLTTPFDISSIAPGSGSQPFPLDPNPSGLRFNYDGTKLFIIGRSHDSVYQYSLPTPFEMPGATYDHKSFGFSSQTTFPTGFCFGDNGSKMYVMHGLLNDGVYQYSLDTPYDLSSGNVTYDDTFLDLEDIDDAPKNLVFNSTGDKMYFVGEEHDRIYQFSVSTPFDLNSAVYHGVHYRRANNTSPEGIAISPDDKTLYISELIGADVREISLPVLDGVESKFSVRVLVQKTISAASQILGLVQNIISSNFVQRGLVSAYDVPLLSRYEFFNILQETISSEFVIRNVITRTVNGAWYQIGNVLKTVPSQFRLFQFRPGAFRFHRKSYKKFRY